jgi:Domain of unknown function (DUF4340)
MKKLKFWLTSLLLLQLLLAAVLLWSNQQEAIKNQPKPLLSIDWQSIDMITIEDKVGGITLLKSTQSWILSNEQLPINIDDINDLLGNLKTLKTGWPVTTLSSSHNRFEVSDDRFVRRVNLYSNGTVIGKLLFGSSTGLRQSYVRRGGDDSIYNASFDTLSILTNAASWFDKSLLSSSDISAVRGPDYNLKRSGATWELNRSGPSIFLGNTQQGRLDQDKVDVLTEALSNLVITKTSSFKPELSNDKMEKVKIEVTDDKGSWTYHFIAAGNYFYVSRSDRDGMFTLNQAVYEQIAGVSQSDLIFAKPAPASAPVAPH